MTKTDEINRQIDEIMDFFDFGKVHDVMSHLGWGWGVLSEVPEEYELRSSAREHLKRLHEYTRSFSGGFDARKEEGVEGGKPWVRISLAFVVESLGEDGEFYETERT